MKKLTQHILSLLLVAIICVDTCAQPNTRTRQIRFATGVSAAADTAETTDNAGRLWYDFMTQKYRANVNGSNTDLISSGSAYTAGNGLNLSGSEFSLNTTYTDGRYLMNNGITVQDSTSLMFAEFASQKLVFATPNFYGALTSGPALRMYHDAASTFDGYIQIGVRNFGNGGLFGGIQISNNESLAENIIKIIGIPTANPCASHGSNAIWNDAGTLKICP